MLPSVSSISAMVPTGPVSGGAGFGAVSPTALPGGVNLDAVTTALSGGGLNLDTVTQALSGSTGTDAVSSTTADTPVATHTAARTGGPKFADVLARAVQGVDDQQLKADQALYGLATGKNADIHSTMIALEEANIALRTMASARDKLVEAYQQVWSMPI